MSKSKIEDILPLTPMQAGLLFQALYDQESTAYHLQMTYEWRGVLNVAHFCTSWEQLAQRHQVLRSAFIHENVKDPVQVVLRERPPQIVCHDLRGVSTEAQQLEITAYQQTDKMRGFNLQKDVLLRVSLFQLADDCFHLVWSYHHILFDGWSFGVLQQEFMQLYEALCANSVAQLKPVVPYRHYIGWLERQDRDSAETHWKNYLANFETLTSLPRLPAQIDPQDHRVETLTIDAETTQQLQQLAAQYRVTLNTIVQAAWGIILSRYNRTDDVLFGAIVSGRPSALRGVEDMVGLFINAVPVRVCLDDKMSVAGLLEQLQREALEAERAHFLPLAEIQAQSELGQQDLFDHLIVFENYPADSAENAPSEFAIRSLDVHDRTHYNFDITVVPGTQLFFQLGYDTTIYSSEQITRIGSHIKTMLSHMVETPNRLIKTLSILSTSEHDLIDKQFNHVVTYDTENQTILDLFSEQVRRNPDQIAAIYQTESWRYAELNQHSNAIAQALQAAGVTPGTRIAISLNRCIEMVSGVLGIMKAGAAYVPIDPDYPETRIQFMLQDAAPTLLLTQTALRDQFSACACPIVCVDEIEWENSAEISLATPSDLAYIIYTSGSTGQPKGVMVSHQNLVQMAYNWREVYQLDQFPLRSLQMASLSFDVFAGDIVRALTNGGQLVICPADTRLEPDTLYGLLSQWQINLFESTPALIMPLMRYIAKEGHAIDFLDQLIIGSDTLAATDYEWLAKQFGQTIRLFNSYGVTEATVDATLFASNRPILSQNTPIGKPLPTVEIAIVDPHGHPAPIGVVGELIIGGRCVAQGYWNRPDLTADRFVNQRYHTGDAARWLPEGDIEFLGRFDNQVKLRGYRIELGEIEAQITLLPLVTAAIVVMRDQILIAYIVGAIDQTELRIHLHQTLPSYMVPNQFISLEALPLTPNGKVNRRALQNRTVTFTPQTDAISPRTESEQKLADIWAAALKIEAVGIHDNFFNLGGHSLKMMQVVSRIHQAFDAKLTLRDFFNAPTIAEQAALLKSAETDHYISIQPAPYQAYYPLSHAQKRLWLQHQLDDAAAYNMPEAIMIEDTLNIPALELALQTIIKRHEALRTVFEVIDGDPVQRILPYCPFSLKVLTVKDEAEAKAIADAEAITRFELTEPPLLRATILTLAERKHLFLLTVHHIIGDGWSGTVLHQEILALYAAFRENRPNPLPPLRIHYKDFAVWQNARGFEKEEAYWLKTLAGVPNQLRLPYDFQPVGNRTFQGSMVTAIISAETTTAIQAVATRHKTTLSNVMLALFKLLLYQISKQSDICIGVATANRTHPDLENLLGFFVNVLPIRTQLSDELDFDNLVTQVTEQMDHALAHQDYPLDLLIEKLNPVRVANRQPILNVIYGFQNFADVTIEMGSTTDPEQDTEQDTESGQLSGFALSFETSKFDLTLFLELDNGQILLSLEYDTGLFRPKTAQRCVNALERFATLIAEG